MSKQGCLFFAFLLSSCFLSGCVSGLWTGATLVYDRHNVYKKLNDYRLSAEAHRALYSDKLFKQQDCTIELAIFNGDILLAGQVPSLALRQIALTRLAAIPRYRRLFNQIRIGRKPSSRLEDSWITTKIRSHIFADASIDPNVFKVVTSDHVVYLMGDVRPDQAERVIHIARTIPGVERVVKMLKYYNLSEKPLNDG